MVHGKLRDITWVLGWILASYIVKDGVVVGVTKGWDVDSGGEESGGTVSPIPYGPAP